MIALWLVVTLVAVATIYTATRLVSVNTPLLMRQYGLRTGKLEVLPARVGLAVFVLYVALDIIVMLLPGLETAITQIRPLLGILLIVVSAVLCVQLFRGRRLKLLAGVVVAAVIGAWWVWPNWLTVSLYAMVVVFAVVSFAMWEGMNFRTAMVLLGLFVLTDMPVWLIGVTSMQESQALLGQAHPWPIFWLVPSNWQLDMHHAFSLGTGAVAFPACVIVAAGLSAYTNSGNWLVLRVGLVSYALGLLGAVAMTELVGVEMPFSLIISLVVVAGIAVAAHVDEQLLREL
ncbi:MAG TPA: hypothetical protein VFO38_03760 [Candidatus Saccharimonadales bacterium]|nr:hypothetical protein [Candidatus Saccharimonadales bacterium]